MNSASIPWITEGRDFFNTPMPGYTPYTYPHPLTLTADTTGDLDGDGTVTLADLRLMIQMLLGQTTVDLAKADLDGNGQLGLGDVRALFLLLLKEPS